MSARGGNGTRPNPILKGSIRVAATYFVAATLWILFSDDAAVALARNMDQLAQLNTFKGCFFVLATTLMLFALSHKYGKSLQGEQHSLIETANLLKLTEMRQADILNSIPGYIYLKDRDLRYTFANQEVCDLFGLSQNQIVGKSDSELFDAATAAQLRTNDLKVIDEGRTILEQETNVVVSTGASRTYLSKKMPIYGAEGNPIGLCGISTDITEQHAQAEVLAQTEERLQLALMVSKLAVWEIEFASGRIFREGFTQEIMGVEPGVGLLSDFDEVLHPDDRERVLTRLRAIEFSDDGIEDTFRIIRNGEIAWIHTYGQAVVRPGHGRTAVGIGADVTAEMQQILESQHAQLRRNALFDKAQDGIIVIRRDGSVVEANESFAQMIGVPHADVTNMWVWDWDRSLPRDQIQKQLLDEVGSKIIETNWTRADGTTIDVEISGVCGKVNGEDLLICTCRDTTQRNAREWVLKQSEEQFRTVMEASPNGILLVDEKGIIQRVNRETESIFGFSRKELVGQPVEVLVPPESVKEHSRLREEFVNMPNPNRHMGQEREVLGRNKYGDLIRLEVGLAPIVGPNGEILTVTTCVDVTERWNSQEEIRRLALFDDLTGLPNRHGFIQMLQRSIESAESRGSQFGVAILDIDRFRNLNDSHGHDFGDKLIQRVAGRVKDILDEGDYLARIGGDEFAILTPYCSNDSTKLDKIVDSLSLEFQQPLALNGTVTYVTFSVGACAFPGDAQDTDELFRCLDISLSEAKAQGRGRSVRYSEEMGKSAMARQQNELALWNAVDREEFLVLYQPIVDVPSRRIIGAEALVRWNHPELGMVGPDEFISICEDTNLIIPLGRWIMNEACRQAKCWQAEFMLPLKMSVNISPRQFADAELIEDVRRSLEASGIEHGSLQIEITEGLLIANPEDTARGLERLKALGAKIAIDDFGTGYSSLSYLHRYPIDCLKVDRSFVTGVLEDEDAATICRTIISLAHNLQMTVLAEGVETAGQEAFLRGLNCEMIQGYLYGHPLTAEEFTERLRSQGQTLRRAA